MKFPKEVVLSIVTDRCLCKIDDLKDALDCILNTSILTHKIPLALDIVGPFILKIYPELNIDVSDVKQYIQQSIRRY